MHQFLEHLQILRVDVMAPVSERTAPKPFLGVPEGLRSAQPLKIALIMPLSGK